MAKKPFASDYLEFNEATGSYIKTPDQIVRDDVEKHHWIHVLQTVLKDWRLYLMLVPMLLIFLFWRYFPMYELLGAFKDGASATEVGDQYFVGFKNFKTIFIATGNYSNDYAVQFWCAFRNTFLLSFYGLCFGFPMPIILALFFNEIKLNAVRSVYQVLTYLPKFISTVVMTSLVSLLLCSKSALSDVGVVSRFLVSIGAISQENAEMGLMFNPQYFRTVYQVSGIWETAGYDSIVFFAAVIAVSPTSYEAAQIDGAGKMSQMRYVVLPSILSTIVIMLITKIGSLLNVGYEKVLLLYDVKTYQTADVVSTFAQRIAGMGEESSGKGLTAVGSAAEMLNNVIGMLLVIGANTIAKKASDVSLY